MQADPVFVFTLTKVTAECFREAVGIEQLRIARDFYALLHLPMIAGTVLYALGVKKVLEHTGDPLRTCRQSRCAAGWPSTPWPTSPFGGATLRASRYPACSPVSRASRSSPSPCKAAALVALAALALIWITLIAYETIRLAAYRQEVRSGRTHGAPP